MKKILEIILVIILLLILKNIDNEIFQSVLWAIVIISLYKLFKFSEYIEKNSISCFDTFFIININEKQKIGEIFIARKNFDIKLNIRMNYIYFYIEKYYIGKKRISNSFKKELLINLEEHENKLIDFALKKMKNFGLINYLFSKDIKLIKKIKKSKKMVFRKSYLSLNT